LPGVFATSARCGWWARAHGWCKRHAGQILAATLAMWPAPDQFRTMPSVQLPPHATSVTQDALPVRWRPDRVRQSAAPELSLPTALRRGLAGRCPACGQGRIFGGWLRVSQACGVCAAPLGNIQADDAPPYFTVFIVAHVIIGAQILLERVHPLSVAAEMMLLLPATLLLTLALIRPVKGATIGLMLKLGFMKPADPNPHG
jgi:uncharacterized protein (DUF983 family)